MFDQWEMSSRLGDELRKITGGAERSLVTHDSVLLFRKIQDDIFKSSHFWCRLNTYRK